MSSLHVAALTFVALAAAGLLGLWLSPDSAATRAETRDSVRLMQGVISSMAAMLLGLLVASATQRYRDQDHALVRLASEVVTLDRMLVEYGPEADAARASLRRTVAQFANELSEKGGRLASGAHRSQLFDEVLALMPASPRQTFIHGHALNQLLVVERTRTALVTAEQTHAVQLPLVIMLVSWFGWVFMAINLFATRSTVVRIATVCGSLAVAGGLFLIYEFDRPFTGMLALSNDILLRALDAAQR